MKIVVSAVALFSLAVLVGAGPGTSASASAAAAPSARPATTLVMEVPDHPRRHHPRRVHVHRYHGNPSYGYGYRYTPYTDWTTMCLEDLGYGRRGMYGCGR